MFKTQRTYQNNIIPLKEQINKINKNKDKLKSFTLINNNKKDSKFENFYENKIKKGNNPYIERIKIYHNKKNCSIVNDKNINKLYHNEINNKEKKEIKVLRKSKSKMKYENFYLKLNKSIDNFDNLWNTERTYEKNDDIHCITMATTPKKKFNSNFKSFISLNKSNKLIHKKDSHFSLNKNKTKNFNQRNLIKDKNFSDFYKEEKPNLFLTTQENNNDFIEKYLEADTNYSVKEIINSFLNNNDNNEINKLYDKNLKTPREKSYNNFILKDGFKDNNYEKKYFNLKNKENFKSKKDFRNITKNRSLSKNNLLTLNTYNNSSQKTLNVSRYMNNKKSNINNSKILYKSLSKSKNNTNYLNKSFCFQKNSCNNRNNINLKINHSLKNNNYKNNLFKNKKRIIDTKDTNNYLAPIMESNKVIENENCHILENTICTKNKIVKKKKLGENLKEENQLIKKIDNNEKVKKAKNEKEKNNNNKFSFTYALKQTNKKIKKKEEIIQKNNINVTKIKKNNIKIPDIHHHNRNISFQKGNFLTEENIEKNILNNSTFSMNQIFNGKIDDYILTKELGKGSYAVVQLAIHRKTKEKYAIKIYSNELFSDPVKRNTVKNEINILKQLNHNNIMKLYDVIDTSRYLYLIQEYINGISLLEIIKSEKNKYIEQKRAIKLFLQILKAISYCQSKNINHRDIKLENILVIEDNIVKIIDFGFAVISDKETYHKFFCGTPSYMSPEIVNREKYIAQYSDIWSLGVLLYTMLYGRFPFREKDDDKLFKKINSGIFSFPEDIIVNEKIKILLKKILNVNPILRPSLDQIIKETKKIMKII